MPSISAAGGVSGGAGITVAGAAQFAGPSQAQLVALLQEREQAIEVLTMKYEQPGPARGARDDAALPSPARRRGTLTMAERPQTAQPQNTRILEARASKSRTRRCRRRTSAWRSSRRDQGAREEARGRDAESRGGVGAHEAAPGRTPPSDPPAIPAPPSWPPSSRKPRTSSRRRSSARSGRRISSCASRAATDRRFGPPRARVRNAPRARAAIAVAAADDVADSLRAPLARPTDRAELLADAREVRRAGVDRVKVLLAQARSSTVCSARSSTNEAALAKAAATSLWR